MAYVVGFSGTIKGMTTIQKGIFIAKITSLDDLYENDVEFHHGDCEGADEEADRLVRQYCPTWKVHIHPPTNQNFRAFCDNNGDTVVHQSKKYLLRNNDIAQICNELIATPESFHEMRRSGTWATVRRAKRHNKLLFIITPNGEIKYD